MTVHDVEALALLFTMVSEPVARLSFVYVARASDSLVYSCRAAQMCQSCGLAAASCWADNESSSISPGVWSALSDLCVSAAPRSALVGSGWN